MHYQSATLHIKDTGTPGNVTEFRGVAFCYNLESLMIVHEADCDVTFFMNVEADKML